MLHQKVRGEFYVKYYFGAEEGDGTGKYALQERYVWGNNGSNVETKTHKANTPSVCKALKGSHERPWGDLFFVVQGDESRTGWGKIQRSTSQSR